MNQVNTYEPQARRIHPLGILFSFGKSIKEFLFPVVVFLIFNLNSHSIFMMLGKIAVILYLIYEVISVLLGWWRFKYVFTDKELRVYEGRFVKEKRFIRLDRIQNMQRNTLFFHRLFGLTSITLHLASSGDGSSVKLDVISREEAERIQRFLNLGDSVARNDEESVEREDKEQIAETPKSESPFRTKHYEMTMKDILAASFTSLSLFALIPVLFALYSKADDLFSIEDYADQAVNFFEGSWGLLVVVIILVLILSALFGIVKNYLQFGNFQVTSDHERIFIQKGVFNHTEFSIPKKKVQAVKLNKGLIRRWFGFAEVELISAGGTEEEDSETASTLFPFITERKALALLPEILPGFKIDPDMVKLPRAAFFVKMMRPSYVWIIATAVVLYFWPQLWYLSLALLVLIVILRIMGYIHGAYLLNGFHIQLQSGSFSTELLLTTRRKIEELEVTESWLQRKFGLASLEISTRENPVHVSTIADIPKEQAVEYYQWYVNG